MPTTYDSRSQAPPQVEVCHVEDGSYGNGCGSSRWRLLKLKGRDAWAIEFEGHCSCDFTHDELEDAFAFTWEQVVALARAKCEVRVPDTPTTTPALLGLYAWVRARTIPPTDDAVTASACVCCTQRSSDDYWRCRQTTFTCELTPSAAPAGER